MTDISNYDVLSQVIGWTYFTAWTISFYGQIYENFKLKRAEGIKFDYVVLNFTGYVFYSTALSAGYFGGSEQGVGGVQIQDLLFAYHGILMTIVQLVQMFIYPVSICFLGSITETNKLQNKFSCKNEQVGQNKVSQISKICITVYCTFFFLYFITTKNLFTPPNYLNIWNMMGYVKVAITFKKYMIQIYYNYKRKSTEGWSIFNVLCDFTGGILSFLQTFIDHTYRNVDVVIPKIALGLFTMAFDIYFILQHYFIYRNPLGTPIELKKLVKDNQQNSNQEFEQYQIAKQTTKD